MKRKEAMKRNARQARRIFLMFALPCEQNSRRRKRLEKKFCDDYSPSEEYLEKLFPIGVARLRKSVRVRNLWTQRGVMAYWVVGHNKIIKQGGDIFGEIPSCYREFCKVHVVEYDPNRKLKVPLYLEGKLNQGDRVFVHRGHVIMKK